MRDSSHYPFGPLQRLPFHPASLWRRLGPPWRRWKRARLIADGWRLEAEILVEYHSPSFERMRLVVPIDKLTNEDGISVVELRRRAAIVERWPFDVLEFAELDQGSAACAEPEHSRRGECLPSIRPRPPSGVPPSARTDLGSRPASSGRRRLRPHLEGSTRPRRDPGATRFGGHRGH